MIPLPSPNFGPRLADQPIDMLVLHYTGMIDAQTALDRLCDPEAQVSSHYVLDRDGSVYQLVAEDQRAWHAGLSCWRGHRDVNSRSIGIEIVNPGHEFGLCPYPAAQIAALIPLCRGILSRHPIPARNVVGHSDVAPARKQDPGELFPWRDLAQAGVGLWPQACDQGPPDLESCLAEIGYDLTDPVAARLAFQRRFRPAQMDGMADRECLDLARGLIRLFSGS